MADVIITITGTIDSARFPAKRDAFLREHPIPPDADGNELYTFEEWLTIKVWKYINGEIRQGRIKQLEDGANLDSDLIQ